MTTHPEPQDQYHRTRIANDLATTLFVKAGAGTGKTTSLVNRVYSLVVDGGVGLHEIGAITFTNKAASELRHRIRQKLQDALSSNDDGHEVLRRAIDALPSAMIGTIHAFAKELLESYGSAIGLPLVFRVMQDVPARVFFDEAWSKFVEGLFADPKVRESMAWLVETGVSTTEMRELARILDDSTHAVLPSAPATTYGPISLDGFESEIKALAACFIDLGEVEGLSVALDLDDRLAARIVEIVHGGRRILELVEAGELGLAMILVSDRHFPKLPSFKVGNLGKKDSWPGSVGVKGVRERVVLAGAALQACVGLIRTRVLEAAFGMISVFVAELSERRISEGLVTFNDLLTLSVRLVETADQKTLSEIQGRFKVLLVDEFQDTDPRQLRLISRVAGVSDESVFGGDLELAPLFFVGDPRQSIYRFRGADIASYLGVAAKIPPSGKVALRVNFRARGEITDWVNRTFAGAFGLEFGTQDEGLEWVRNPDLKGDPVLLVSIADESAPAKRTAGSMRRAEAKLAAAAILKILDEEFQVEDANGIRTVGLGDIAVIIGDRTGLGDLLAALDENGLRYQASNTTVVYSEGLLKELFLVLRAAARPYDEKAVLDALITSLLGVSQQQVYDFCGEAQSLATALVSWRTRWVNGEIEEPATLDDALALIMEIHVLSKSAESSAVLRYAIERLHLGARAAALHNADEIWRRLDFIVEEAATFARDVSSTLHSYVDFVFGRVQLNPRTTESEGADIGKDALRVMTIHGSKGLEFPVVVLTGMSSSVVKSSSSQKVIPYGAGLEFRLNSGFASARFDDALAAEALASKQERVRLLYVGATRARDHLIVTIPATQDELGDALALGALDPSAAFAAVELNYEFILCGSPLLPVPLAAVAPRSPREPDTKAAVPIRNAQDWIGARRELVTRATRLRSVNPSALSRFSSDADLSADERTFYRRTSRSAPSLSGAALGTAVHSCLAIVNLSDPETAAIEARSYLSAHGYGDDEIAKVVRLVVIALGAPSVTSAVSPMRELSLGVTLPNGLVLESVLDLAYDTPAGIRIVDYKVTSSLDPAKLASYQDAYRVQGGLYRLALSRIVSPSRVAGVTFVFVSDDGFVETECPEVGEDELYRLIERYVAAGTTTPQEFESWA